MTVTTVYADTSDASLRKTNATFATAHDSASADEVQAAGTTTYLEFGTGYNVYVTFFPFDTSGIGADQTISSAVFSVYKNGDAANTDTQTLGIVQTKQTTWNSLVVGDFSKRGDTVTNPTEGCTRVSYSAGAGTGYMDFTLNATGIGWIARTGETKPATASATGKTQLATRFKGDMDNVAPTGANYMQWRMADYAGTTSDPVLVVTHAGTGPTNLKTYNTNAFANIKTINTNVIANVKTLNTNV